jgi:hypothetical protein
MILKSKSYCALQQHALGFDELERIKPDFEMILRKAECYYLLADYEIVVKTVWKGVFQFPEEALIKKKKIKIVKALIRLQIKTGNAQVYLRLNKDELPIIMDKSFLPGTLKSLIYFYMPSIQVGVFPWHVQHCILGAHNRI